jgi:hypothetical protein
MSGLLEHERRLLSALSPTELRQLATLMRRLAVSLEASED